MATLTLGTSGNYTWYLDYTLTQSVANNQSTVSYTLRIRRNVSASSGAWWGTPARTFTVNIGGSTDAENFASIDFRDAQDINFTSGSFTWTHNADGTMAAKSVTGSVSGSYVSSGFPVPTSVGSPSISFPTIPRAATSITRSGSTATGTASTLTISPLVSSFYYVLQYKSPATGAWTTIGPAGGIVGSSWPYSHTVPHAEIPNAGSGTIQYQVTTKQTSGGTTIGSPVSASFTYTVPSTVLPTVGVPTWAEGATTTGLSTLTNSGAVFAQGWSRLKPTFTSSPGTGATLSSALATVNGHTGSVSSAGTFAAPITTQGSSATFSVTATDSRGRTDTETGTVSPAVHRWAAPTANAGSPVITPTVTTQTIALSGLTATTTSFYLSAAQRNALETRTGYRDMTTGGAWIYGSWTARPVSASDATDNAYAPGTALTVATGLDPTHEYQVTLQVRDIFGKNAVNYSNGLPYVESVLVVPAQGVLVAYEGNIRVGIKKIPTLGALDVGGDIYQNGNLVIDASDAATSTAKGIVELATDAEVTTGTDTTRVVTPAGLVTGLARSGGMRYVQTVKFTANGTFSKASYPWLRGVFVRVQAAGGAGGGAVAAAANQHSAGGGGGGGGYAEKFLQASALAASETVTVGQGGNFTAGGTGTTGGNSSFGAHCVATGGSGGAAMSSTGLMVGAIPGYGGDGTVGDLLVPGQPGEYGIGYATLGIGGTGGGSVLGGGARGTYTGSGGGSNAGAAGLLYGGGGGGAQSNAGNATNRGGGNGADGVVIVDLFA